MSKLRACEQQKREDDFEISKMKSDLQILQAENQDLRVAMDLIKASLNTRFSVAEIIICLHLE